MIDVPTVDLGIGYALPVDTVIEILLATVGFFMLENLAIYLLTWNVTMPWLKAWWDKGDIGLEYTKSKRWVFHNTKIDSEFPDVWMVDKRPVPLRREAFGIAPHKVRMAFFASDFGAVTAPQEINGKRLYHPLKTYSIDDKTGELQEQDAPDAMLVPDIRYEVGAISPSEFVQYQQINIDPSIIERFAAYRELKVYKKLTNAWNTLMNPDFLKYAIPMVIVGAIVFMWLSNNNTAVSCNEHLTELYRTGQCVIQPAGKAAAEAGRNISTGGAIVSRGGA